MVNRLATVEPRSSGSQIIPNSDGDGDYWTTEQTRNTFLLDNNLDEYAEVTIKATHSQDTDFSDALINEDKVPILAGDTREVAFLDPNEILQFELNTPTAPSSGEFILWRERDNTPKRLKSNSLNQFKELNQGRSFSIDFQESLGGGGSITAGIRNPSDSDTNIFIQQFGVSVGQDALITTEIDHGSYTDGTTVPVINQKPDLQAERPLNASITKNPTTSNPQESAEAFLPGGSTGTAPGGRFSQPDFEISPGQKLTVTLTNDTTNTSRFGFGLRVIETVKR